MNFCYDSKAKSTNLIKIFEEIELVLKLSPPQITCSLIDNKKGIFKQIIPIKSLKKSFEFEIKYNKISENTFLLEIISGPLKKSILTIEFKDDSGQSKINLNFDIKLGIKYKFFSSIIKKKLKLTNLALIKRLENLAYLLYNDKYPIKFENNFSTMVLELSPEKQLFFDGWWLGDIHSSFIGGVYSKISFKDRTIVDVGANIADSSIYFATKGAKRVIALEPFPKNFNFGQTNIKKNSFEDVIELILSGCSAKTSKIQIDPNLSGLSYKMEEAKGGQMINQITLKQISEKYQIDAGLLKMNCEGCEYDVILNTPEKTLKNFSEILIQYHDGGEILSKRLSNIGFSIEEKKYSSKKGQIFATLNM